MRRRLVKTAFVVVPSLKLFCFSLTVAAGVEASQPQMTFETRPPAVVNALSKVR